MKTGVLNRLRMWGFLCIALGLAVCAEAAVVFQDVQINQGCSILRLTFCRISPIRMKN